MARVRPNGSCQRFGKHTAPVKSKPYLEWIHQLPCIVSGQSPVEAAHVSTANEPTGHTGRAKSNKASDRWVLPLAKHLHDQQHKGAEMEFWKQQGINPHNACLVLWGLFNERGDSAIPQATALIQTGMFKSIGEDHE